MLIKLKFTSNIAILDLANNSTETVIFKPEEKIGIVDLRLLDYYQIKQGISQQNLSKYYRLERTDTLCEYFNKFVNMLKREREQKKTRRKLPMVRFQ